MEGWAFLIVYDMSEGVGIVMRIFAANEYSSLKKCLVVYPQNFQITEIINEQQKSNIGNVDLNKANKQYNQLVNTLSNMGVEIQFLDILDSPYQVYTRDIGFVIGETMFISNMKADVRSKETESLKGYIKRYTGLNIVQLSHHVEGGDVFVHQDTVFIGNSDRTDIAGIQEISSYCKGKKVIEIQFDEKRLHLDCVFNILDQDTCVVSEFLHDKDEMKKHFENTIEVSKEDALSLATNFVHIGNRKLICTNEKLANRLAEIGYKPYFIDYSEFIKVGGSVRCCTLPLLRSDN